MSIFLKKKTGLPGARAPKELFGCHPVFDVTTHTVLRLVPSASSNSDQVFTRLQFAPAHVFVFSSIPPTLSTLSRAASLSLHSRGKS